MGDQYCGIFDFHDNPYEKGIAELLIAFQELSKLEISSSIEKISIEYNYSQHRIPMLLEEMLAVIQSITLRK
jgi:hypothetical protein